MRAIDLGISSYITKPIDKDKLIEAVSKAADRIELEREVILNRKKILEYNEQLEDKVRERTSELEVLNRSLLIEIKHRKKTEIELRSAKEISEKANRAKDSFLAKVSHELRTPMNGIIGIISILKDTELNEKQKRFIEMIGISSNIF
jgi:signal transduction histidine kinase